MIDASQITPEYMKRLLMEELRAIVRSTNPAKHPEAIQLAKAEIKRRKDWAKA